MLILFYFSRYQNMRFSLFFGFVVVWRSHFVALADRPKKKKQFKHWAFPPKIELIRGASFWPHLYRLWKVQLWSQIMAWRGIILGTYWEQVENAIENKWEHILTMLDFLKFLVCRGSFSFERDKSEIFFLKKTHLNIFQVMIFHRSIHEGR
jgi:hypothetical protein